MKLPLFSLVLLGSLFIHPLFGQASSAQEPPPASTLMPGTAPVSTPLPSLPSGASTTETAPEGREEQKANSFEHKLIGTIVSVSGNTLVIREKKERTFTLTPGTKITDAHGKLVPLNKLEQGNHVTGQYVELLDGTLTLYRLKVNKSKK